MPESGLKRFWNAIKPPPAVPRRPSEHSPTRSRGFWEFLKPPPAAGGPPKTERTPEERRRRKRLVVGTVAVILIGAGAWGIYTYIASAPQRAQTVLQEGKALVAQGKYQEALDRFTRATGIWPPLAAGYFERGLAHRNLRQTDAAVQDFEQAINADSNLADAHTALGTIYRERGDLKSAVNEFTLAINLGSAVEANYQRGQMYESLGEHQKALDDYNQAIGGMPDSPFVYRARALTRENLGDAAGAKDDRQKADSIEFPGRKPAQ
jgi:tetratricopeptide (TPR) repeat protein